MKVDTEELKRLAEAATPIPEIADAAIAKVEEQK